MTTSRKTLRTSLAAAKSHLVPFCFRFRWIKRGIGVVLIMLWVLSASVVHAKNKPFAPADHVGPYRIGLNNQDIVTLRAIRTSLQWAISRTIRTSLHSGVVLLR
jgi:hypothetical protein